MDESFIIFVVVGFLAQIVDGALGMAYGVVSSTVLLSFGVPPATASATVHAAEVFTTAASAGSHVAHKNVRLRLLLPLALAGMAGGALGAFVLTSIDGDTIKPFITVYLGLMGFIIVWRGLKGRPERRFGWRWSSPLGFVGGFLDASGGGGWGPTVTGTLIGGGTAPREAIGSANTAEFFVTSAISVTFLGALLTGHWDDTGGLRQHLGAVAGLVVGGLIAAPIAGYITKRVDHKVMTLVVGVTVILLAAWQTAGLLNWV